MIDLTDEKIGEATGGGGRLHTLAFIGRGEFEGQDQELTTSTPTPRRQTWQGPIGTRRAGVPRRP